MTQTEEMILSYFEDEESKYIFQKRLEFNNTKNFKAIRDIIEKYIPALSIYDYSPQKRAETIDIIRSKNNVWIWGAGVRSERLLTIEGCKIFGIIDIDCNKQGKHLMGTRIFSPNEVDFKQIDCLIISMCDEYSVKCAISNAVALGMNSDNILVFNDFCSKTLEEKQYFEDFMCCNDGETFIDAGALNLNTTMQFMKHCMKYGVTDSKVIAFEPDVISFKKMQKIIKDKHIENVEVVNAGLYSSNTILQFNLLGNGSSSISENGSTNVNVVMLDSKIQDKVTFIKMDIEGAELEALKGCQKTILKYKPKLAICVYHKPEDIIKIPLYIKSLVPEYKLYMRHYSNSVNETVLYAIVD